MYTVKLLSETGIKGLGAVFRRALAPIYSLLWFFPGAPAFHWCRGRRVEALVEFLWVFFVSVIPLAVVFLVFIGISDGKGFAAINGAVDQVLDYTQAGQLFFYVGGILGGVAHLLVVDDLRSDYDSDKDEIARHRRRERGWLMGYLILALVISILLLVLYHLKVLGDNSWLSLSSFIVYGVSLYFWFVLFLYNHIRKNGNSLDLDEKEDGESIVRSAGIDLEGFRGE